MNARAARRKPPNGDGDEVPKPAASERPPGFIALVFKKVQDNAASAIAIAALSVVAAIGTWTWATGHNWLRTQVVGIIADEFASNPSRLAREVRSVIISELKVSESEIATALDGRMSHALQEAFATKVGAVSAGRFVLEPATPSQVVFVYKPPGHDASFRLTVRGIRSGEKVVLVPPAGFPQRAFTEDGFFPVELDPLLETMADPQAEATAELVVSPARGEMRHLYALTFHLRSEGNTTSPMSSRVELQYLTLISPPINTGGS